jgi:hypothetical protein
MHLWWTCRYTRTLRFVIPSTCTHGHSRLSYLLHVHTQVCHTFYMYTWTLTFTSHTPNLEVYHTSIYKHVLIECKQTLCTTMLYKGGLCTHEAIERVQKCVLTKPSNVYRIVYSRSHQTCTELCTHEAIKRVQKCVLTKPSNVYRIVYSRSHQTCTEVCTHEAIKRVQKCVLTKPSNVYRSVYSRNHQTCRAAQSPR